MARLSHISDAGDAHMVDVSGKDVTQRVAVAQGQIIMAQSTLAMIQDGTAAKGDVLATARIAGIMAAKKTSELIPLCHPLPIKKVTLDLELDVDLPGVRISATVKTLGQTGVEMEALTACSIAALTLYDMLKAAEKGMRVHDIHLVHKDGGASGTWSVTP
ncbi:MAG: cyclic pyranopterin monophosphate synthase MoaC [Pseudomonadota bacterium]